MPWFLTNPLFAWLLPLATLPVIFHLFFKLKKRPRVFPTLMFFTQIDPKLSARRQIRHWLVLLLRTLLIFFLLLALARPVWLIGGGSGAVATVVVVDNSGSMQPQLRTATDAARALVTGLRASDTAGVVLLVDDPAVTLPAGLVADKEQVKSALDCIVPTEASGEPGPALARAFAMLETATATRFEVHVFTDLQETEWNKATGDFHPPRTGTQIIIHRFTGPTPQQPNVAITGTELPQKRLLVGRQTPVKVSLANLSAFDADVRLNWTDDAGNKGTLDVAVPKQAEKSALLMTTPSAPGFHWLNLWLEGDGFEPDNKAGVGFVCADKATVFFAGDESQFGLLPLALSPAGLSGLVPVFGEMPKPAPVMVVMLWHGHPAREPAVNTSEPTGETPVPLAFQKYVEAGGNLLIVPVAPMQTNPKGAPVLVFNKSARVLADLREVPLRGVKAFQFSPLPASDGAVLGLEDGRPLLTERRVGKGTIFTSGLAFDPSWSTLPLKSAFLAIVQSMALLRDATADNALVAGERFRGSGIPAATGRDKNVAPTEPADGESAFIKSLAGSPLDWKGERAHLPVLPRAGVYAVAVGKETTYVAVRAADKEGIAKFITSDKVPALSGLRYSVRQFENLEKFLKEARTVRRGLDLFLPFLLLAVLALLLEAWLANPLPRKADVAASVPDADRFPK